jgi:hypothetical protein
MSGGAVAWRGYMFMFLGICGGLEVYRVLAAADE